MTTTLTNPSIQRIPGNVKEAIDELDRLYSVKLSTMLGQGVDSNRAKATLHDWYDVQMANLLGHDVSERQARKARKEERRAEKAVGFKGNDCRVCGELVPSTGARGRPRVVHEACKGQPAKEG